VCEKKNENEAENEGPRTNRGGEVLMSSVKMGRRGGKGVPFKGITGQRYY
jgi:hypothetical protein